MTLKKRTLLFLLIVFLAMLRTGSWLFPSGTVLGADTISRILPWPGEKWENAVDLTSLDPSLWKQNLSGIYWNSRTGRLWLANNSGTFTVLKFNAGIFEKEREYPVGGDLEAITQTDIEGDSVFLLAEREAEIREYGIKDGQLRQTWSLKTGLGDLKNNGPEGLAFIPDEWLAKGGFQDSAGQVYNRSAPGAAGLGGIMLVAVQAVGRAQAGDVYAFDLKKDGTWTAVGRYQTARRESCELAFDSQTGLLYILHNIDGNTLEVTDLKSSPQGAARRFTTLREIRVPSRSNIEGFSLGSARRVGASASEYWCFFADDANERGALRWFSKFSEGGQGAPFPF
jgi:hypothetical protein